MKNKKYHSLACGLRSALLAASLAGPLTSAQAAQSFQVAALDSLTDMNLEDLMNIEVVSVSRRAESLQDTAAAVYVLEGDAIRRSGVRSIPEALRLIPGLHVARIDSFNWAVSARGFNGTVADKLEVLMDGRSLYTPLFSGVNWVAQNTLLHDIERIEVIRGPGAALWGANAVNGVVNIVTRSAGDTQGGVQTVGAGGEHNAYASWRYGSTLNDKGYYRVYAQSQRRAEQGSTSGGGNDDPWQRSQIGFRADITASEADRITLQGDAYRGEAYAPAVADDETMSGENLILRWGHHYSDDSDTTLQIIYDHSKYDDKATYYEDRQSTDVEVKHSFRLADIHYIVAGGGYRYTSDTIGSYGSAILAFVPESRDDDAFNIFAQDQIDFFDEKLRLTVGAKWERNGYSGDELQPSLRMRYRLRDDQSLWAAVSRAVRIPNRLDQDVSALGGVFQGNKSFKPEIVRAFELGYRGRLATNWSIDIATFYNEYEQLRGLSDNLAAPQSLPVIISNEGEGFGHGAELTVRWTPLPTLSLQGGYQYLDLDIAANGDSRDQSIADNDANDAQNQFQLQADWEINDRFSIFASTRWVDDLPDQGVDDYYVVDINLRWLYSHHIELSIRGSSINDSSHAEFGGGAEIQRSVHGQIEWTF